MQNVSPELYSKAAGIVASCTTVTQIEAAKKFVNNIPDEQHRNHLNYLIDRRLQVITSNEYEDEAYFNRKWNLLHKDLPTSFCPSQDVICELIIVKCKYDIQQFSKAVAVFAELKLAVYRNYKHLLIDYYASIDGLTWDDENNVWNK